MLKRTHTVDRGLTSSHTRIETAERDEDQPSREYRVQRLDARRCQTHHEGDQAQIEITLVTKDFFGKREMSKSASMILTPEQARALALAVCPELKSALERISQAWPAHGTATKNEMADAMADIARSALS